MAAKRFPAWILLRKVPVAMRAIRPYRLQIVFMLVAAVVLLGSLGAYLQSISAPIPVVSRTQTGQPTQTKPVQSKVFTTLSDYSALIDQEKGSVVKVEGYGCGGELLGSGFVVAPDLVATNAHVVAGIRSPRVLDGYDSYAATPVLFDPKLDFAVLRVNGLTDTPLVLNQSSSDTISLIGSHTGDHDVLLSYPGGGTFKAELAVIDDEYYADVYDIYNADAGHRDLYEVAASVIPGSSGGALLQQNGQVAGIVFGYPPNTKDTGFVMPTIDFYDEIQQAKALSVPVSTQSCADLGAN